MILDTDKKVVVFEGSNGSGKSSVIQILRDKYHICISKAVPEWFYKYIEKNSYNGYL